MCNLRYTEYFLAICLQSKYITDDFQSNSHGYLVFTRMKIIENFCTGVNFFNRLWPNQTLKYRQMPSSRNKENSLSYISWNNQSMNSYCLQYSIFNRYDITRCNFIHGSKLIHVVSLFQSNDSRALHNMRSSLKKKDTEISMRKAKMLLKHYLEGEILTHLDGAPMFGFQI